MVDIIDAIKERRSIRAYEKNEVPGEVVDRVLEAVRWSPSWANTQCWEVIVVRDPAMKESLQKATPTTNPAWTALGDAPVVFVLCAKLKSSGYYKEKVTTRFGDWFMFDLGIAVQSLCLAAHGFGLGTVIVGMFDHEKAMEALGVPDGYELVSMIPAGYPAKAPPPPKRREVSEFCHGDRF